ncbi:MAG: hypothetical protein AAGD33_08275 [Actinomycetota bacterium]
MSRFDVDTAERTDLDTAPAPGEITVGDDEFWALSGWPFEASDDLTLSRIDPLDGSRTDRPAGPNATDILFDGSDIWITNLAADTVTRLDPVDGTRDEFVTDVGPDQLAFDGTHIRITHLDADTVSRLNPADGSRRGVAVAAGFVWVASAGDDTVSRIDPSTIDDLTAESRDRSTRPTDTTG